MGVFFYHYGGSDEPPESTANAGWVKLTGRRLRLPKRTSAVTVKIIKITGEKGGPARFSILRGVERDFAMIGGNMRQKRARELRKQAMLDWNGFPENYRKVLNFKNTFRKIKRSHVRGETQ
jgi:hypothetical protein